jgi:hypothetical protein
MDVFGDSHQVCIALTTLRKPDLHLPQTPSDATMSNFPCPNSVDTYTDSPASCFHVVQHSIEHVIPPQGPALPSATTPAPSQFRQPAVEHGAPEAKFTRPHAEAPNHVVGPQRKRPTSSPAPGESSRRPRRDRGPNWNLQEMLALVDAKRKEYLEELDTVDACDLMDPDVTK